MVCSSCGNKNAYRISYSASGEKCDSCGANRGFKFADVFFDQRKGPYINENATDPVKHPHGTLITGRNHLASVLKENGLKETGDRRHGSRSPV
jgi:hypothetical protein